MTTSEDVKTLFRRFGGQPETYQEVVREDLAEHSLGKWPMLGQVNLQRIAVIPAAKQTITTAATRPYSESLAVAQAGQIAVADYVASHSYVEPRREEPPVYAPQYVAPRSEYVNAPLEPVMTSVFTTPKVAVPVQAPVQTTSVAQQVTNNLPTAAVRVSALTPMAAQQVQIQPAQVVNTAPSPRNEAPASGLAARFRAQSMAVATSPSQATELPAQSLHGLFGRLAQSQAKAPVASGLLKRKLTK